MKGFAGPKTSYCKRSGCIRFIVSATAGVTMALTTGWANVRYSARLSSDARAAAANMRSSSMVLPPRARMSSSVRASQRMTHSPVARPLASASRGVSTAS